MERPPISIRYDATTGTLAVEMGGPSLSLEELGPLATVVRVDEDDEERMALFLTGAEGDVLLKMIAYILEKVKITPSSRDALLVIEPRLKALREQAP